MAQTFVEALNILEGTGFIQVIAPLLLLWVIIYALLVKSKFLKEDLAAVVAFALSFIVVLNPFARQFIAELTPFFSMFLITIMMIVLIFLMIGAGEKDVASAFKSSSIQYIIITVSLIFIFITISNVLGPSLTPERYGGNATDVPETTKDTMETLTNPGFLGVVILLIIFGTTVYTISRAK